MAPAVAPPTTRLDPISITVYYAADKQSNTAIAYRTEDLERQRREPAYVPDCFDITTPKKESVDPAQDFEEASLKRQLCDFLGYQEHHEPTKAPKLHAHSVAPRNYGYAPAQRPPPAPPAAHMRHHNPELTPAFAEAAKQQATCLPQAFNNDRYRNTATSLAPPNPAMVTRQLQPPSTDGHAQSNGQILANYYARQRPVSESAYSAATKAAHEARQASQITNHGGWSIQGNARASRFQPTPQPPLASPNMAPYAMGGNNFALHRSPSLAAVQQHNTLTRPQNTSAPMGTYPMSGNILTPHRSPSLAAVQQHNIQTRPQSTSAPMGPYPMSGNTFTPHRSPSLAAVQQHNIQARPQSTSAPMGPYPMSGNAFAPQLSPSMAAMQQYSAQTRPQSITPPKGVNSMGGSNFAPHRSPSMATVQQHSAQTPPQSITSSKGLNSTGSGSWSSHPRLATTPVLTPSPGANASPRAGASPLGGNTTQWRGAQMPPRRIDSPQQSWLHNASAQAMQPHAWAKPPLSPPKPGQSQPIHVSADGRYYLPDSTERRFLQPVEPGHAERTPDQYQQAQRQLQQRQESTENWRKKQQEMAQMAANMQAKILAQDDTLYRQANSLNSQPRRQISDGKMSVSALARQYNVDVNATASARPPLPASSDPGGHRVVVQGRRHYAAPEVMHRRAPSGDAPAPSQKQAQGQRHYTAPEVVHGRAPSGNATTPSQQQATQPPYSTPASGAIRNGSFRDAYLNELLPPAQSHGQEVQVFIGLSETQILLLLRLLPEVQVQIKSMAPADRRRWLQQFYAIHQAKIDPMVQLPPNGSQPRQQQSVQLPLNNGQPRQQPTVPAREQPPSPTI